MLENKIQNYSLKLLSLIFTFLIFLFYFLLRICYAEGEFIYDSKGKRNPFIPLVTSDGRLLKLDKEEARGDLVIEGIIYDKNGQSFAIVNGSVVGTGDIVGDYRVLKIEERKVIFIKDGQITEEEINKEEGQ